MFGILFFCLPNLLLIARLVVKPVLGPTSQSSNSMMIQLEHHLISKMTDGQTIELHRQVSRYLLSRLSW